MQKKYNRFEKLKIKIIKKEKRKKWKKKEKRKTPQNCKGPMQRQRFINAIKNATKKKTSSKA